MITHEFKKIVRAYEEAAKQGQRTILATVVALDGSSYRRPGVRMLLLEDGGMVGAVSGGCVEKEVYRQALSVFKSGVPKVMTYDGRYRLGCEGILYILLEPFSPSPEVLKTIGTVLSSRDSFEIKSFYEKEYTEKATLGSVLQTGDKIYPFQESYTIPIDLEEFSQRLPPCFQLILVGAEHDTVQFAGIAAMMGWEVTVVVDPREEKSQGDFPGATHFIQMDAEHFELNTDEQTALLLMTHSYVKDLKYLAALRSEKLKYFGVLGPARRREKLFNELLELYPDTDLDYIESIHGPAGLELGAETPQEIAISVISEIVATVNGKQAVPLREKEGRIHS